MAEEETQETATAHEEAPAVEEKEPDYPDLVICPVPGCGKECKGKRGLAAHERAKHGKAKKPKVEVKPKVPERQEYVCINPCWHNGRLYKRGRTAFFADNYPKDPDGNLRHFELLHPDAPRPVMAEPIVTVTPQ